MKNNRAPKMTKMKQPHCHLHTFLVPKKLTPTVTAVTINAPMNSVLVVISLSAVSIKPGLLDIVPQFISILVIPGSISQPPTGPKKDNIIIARRKLVINAIAGWIDRLTHTKSPPERGIVTEKNKKVSETINTRGAAKSTVASIFTPG
jgi:hypothetical protein